MPLSCRIPETNYWEGSLNAEESRGVSHETYVTGELRWGVKRLGARESEGPEMPTASPRVAVESSSYDFIFLCFFL